MKTRFSTIDIKVVVDEINRSLLGMRVVNVYDIDHKTYLFKLNKPEGKSVLLIEAGIRLHSTDFDWPKNDIPSGFSMKLRKHLRSRRLEKVTQLGIDRIVDLQFGANEAAYHVILELYDRGNIVLTDYEYTILNILRPRTDENSDVRFAVRETYPREQARQNTGLITEDRLREIMANAKDGDNLKKILNPVLPYGPALLEHCLNAFNNGNSNVRFGQEFRLESDCPKLIDCLREAEEFLTAVSTENKPGYILTAEHKSAATQENVVTYTEYHPLLFRQHVSLPHLTLPCYNAAVDEFYSRQGAQRFELKALQQEKQAIKKLDNVKKDHEKRVEGLRAEQEEDESRAALIQTHSALVERALLVVRSALANQIDWDEIGELVYEARCQGDPVASCITGLKLQENKITLKLSNNDDEAPETKLVDIDLALSAHANARKYFDHRRSAAAKQAKTLESSARALKNAEQKTRQNLKEARTTAGIRRARKTLWFEKFLWFISSENYLVIGGRDGQQNELLVKRYLRPGDLYVHADLHGAASVIIKNNNPEAPVPPKTLTEAGTMAVCNSAAWDAKVVTSAWWVHHNQVSKTAPAGEYLSTGSFMIRGKKNYLPPCYLVYGFSVLFKLEDSFVERHMNDRRVRTDIEASDTQSEVTETQSEATETQSEATQDDDVELEEVDTDSDDDKDDEPRTADVTDDGGDHTTVNEDDVTVEDLEAVDDVADKLETLEVKQEQDDVTEAAGGDGEMTFPDTEIDLKHVHGDKFELASTFKHLASAESETPPTTTEAVNRPARMSAKERRKLKKAQKSQGSESCDSQGDTPVTPVTPVTPAPEEKQAISPEVTSQERAPAQALPPKRGQKAKMKKIREKYGDQDEEERALRMSILASAGPQKEVKQKKNKSKQKQQEKKQQRVKERPVAVATHIHAEDAGEVAPAPEPETEEAAEERTEDPAQAVQELLSLCGQPCADDELLFCLPVVAPYSALVNYKYKVKLIPGSTKRGKAAKTALHNFTMDRTATPREKDLFKSLKDADVSRNIPGKVKISAPNLKKIKPK